MEEEEVTVEAVEEDLEVEEEEVRRSFLLSLGSAHFSAAFWAGRQRVPDCPFLSPLSLLLAVPARSRLSGRASCFRSCRSRWRTRWFPAELRSS